MLRVLYLRKIFRLFVLESLRLLQVASLAKEKEVDYLATPPPPPSVVTFQCVTLMKVFSDANSLVANANTLEISLYGS